MARVMEIVTPLGSDVLLFHTMHGQEEMSRLSEYQLELLSKDGAIDLDKILGQNITVNLEIAGDKTRYFNGYVTRFTQQGMSGRLHRYTATVRPWLWFLTRTADCRILQDKNVPDIITSVFADHGTADFALELTSTYEKWGYCVQYRETDFNFVSRLMEQEGIYYYFRHQAGKHTMVLTDSVGKHKAGAGYEKVPFIPPAQLTRPDIEHIGSWELSREVQPGAFVHWDQNFELPYKHLEAGKVLTRGYQPSNYEVYDYPGGYNHVTALPKLFAVNQQYAAIRIDEFGTQFEVTHGSTNARGLSVGNLMTLDRHPREDQNHEFLLVAAMYDFEFYDYEALPDEGVTDFRCSFAAMTTAQQFRPRRLTPKPFVQGPQTAVVVGPPGEEIFTDKYARVKVQFHWDRQGKNNAESSCWVRVSQMWAGKVWGSIDIPRINQEVIVDFLEGDPDQPIITGRVYNAEQMPPYELPTNKTQSGIKSRSTLGGSPANFNEFRFEDKKGSEQVYLHAEKNQDIEVENDETHWVGHDRKKTVDHDETTLVKHDRTETVDNNETITVHANRTETVDKNETITIHMNRTETVDKDEAITVGMNRTRTVGLTETITVGVNQAITVGAAQETTVGAAQTNTVGAAQENTIGADQTNTIGSDQTTEVGSNLSTTVGADEEREVGGARGTKVAKDDKLQVGKNYVLQAGDSITLKTGSASITMKKDGTIAIKGKDITIEGSGKINVKASSNITMKGSKILQN